MMPGLGDDSLMPFVGVSGSNVPSGSAGVAAFVLPAPPDGWYADIVFATPFPSTNYALVMGIEAVNRSTFVPTITNKLATGFRILMNTRNIANLVAVTWMAVGY
jgi:hypothetical protein